MKAKTHLDNCDEKDMKIKFYSEDGLNIIIIVKDNIYYLKLWILEYDIIEVFEGIDVNITDGSRKCIIVLLVIPGTFF